jgi:DNA-binding CsgD family transcriptional regulator
MAGMIASLGRPEFEKGLLDQLQPLVPAASFSVYRTGRRCQPRLFLSGSRGVPDTTRDCWRAYLSGPHLNDRTLAARDEQPTGLTLCHLVAEEAPPLHRRKVYEAHGVAERISVVEGDSEGLFAVNLYRHRGQHAFSDGQLADFEQLAPVLLSLVRKHMSLSGANVDAHQALAHRRTLLSRLDERLTDRELDVCARLLLGMSQDGIAQDLGLSLPTVKTYRNRAFQRLGIHFRSQLFALAMP